jgi:hypothetical protein
MPLLRPLRRDLVEAVTIDSPAWTMNLAEEPSRLRDGPDAPGPSADRVFPLVTDDIAGNGGRDCTMSWPGDRAPIC